MLIGLNSAISMFGGGVLAWGLIGPLLVHYGECIGVDISEDDPKWKGMYSFGKLTNQDKETPSPRFWLLWPAVMVMICSSIIEMFIREIPFPFFLIFAVLVIARGGRQGTRIQNPTPGTQPCTLNSGHYLMCLGRI